MKEKSVHHQVFDKKGHLVCEGDILKVFHFIGARNKRHYMYKQVAIKGGYLFGMHLTAKGGYRLGQTKDTDETILADTEVVQCAEYPCPGDKK